MSQRRLRELGIPPFAGFALGLVGLIVLSEYLFLQTEFARYILILIPLSFTLRLSETARTEFLSITFPGNLSRKIRIAENIFICMPFAILLLYHANYLESLLLLTVSAISAGLSLRSNLNYSIPTPFSKNPFEFTIGFRSTFFIFPIAYTLTIIAIWIDNMNLGIFAMLLVFLVSLSYYVKPENEYYVWVHSDNPRKFILQKMKTATKYCAVLVLPITITLIGFYFKSSFEIILFTGLGFTFLWTMILVKYSAYPNEMNLPEAILIALCIYFPPLLIALLPFFYFKSIKKLKVLLK